MAFAAIVNRRNLVIDLVWYRLLWLKDCQDHWTALLTRLKRL
jgi:hypothetical protein